MRRESRPRAPGLRLWLPLPGGRFREFLRDPLGFQFRARAQYGDVFRLQVGPLLNHFVFHPDHVRYVLHERPKNFVRGWHYGVLRGLCGDNLIVSEGDYWRRQRRLAQPAFHRSRLTGYADIMVDATLRLRARWQAEAGQGEIDVGQEMSRLALAIASRTLFDRDISYDADVVGRSLRIVMAHLEHRLNHPFTTLPKLFPTPGNLRFRGAARILSKIVLDLVRERRRSARDHGDLLSMLMQAQDEETSEAMTDEQLRSEALAFLLAGHETSATALTWTWYLLATHIEVQTRLREEVQNAVGDRPPTLADLPQLPLTRMVLEESMRLYPPVWTLPRQAVERDAIGGFDIPARSTVLLCQAVTHRHPKVWEQPDVFDPDRFSPERAAAIPKGAYFPFLGGPHQCIGQEFAMLEMRLVVALLVQAFELRLVPGQSIQPHASVALRPAGPVRVLLRTVGCPTTPP